jgi:hypothetical protein
MNSPEDNEPILYGLFDRDEIAKRAAVLWEKDGCPPGREQEYWNRAQEEFRAEQTQSRERPKPQL